MSASAHLLRRAIEFSKAGEKEIAQQLLLAVFRDEPRNEVAWAWYIDTFTREEERIQALEQYLKLFPNNVNAQRVLINLLQAQNIRLGHESEQVGQTTKQIYGGIAKKPRRSSLGSFAPIFMAALILCLFAVIILVSLNASSRVNKLSHQITDLNIQHSSLVTEHQSLLAQFDLLNSEYSAVVQQYNSLVNEYNALVTEHASLVNEHSALESIALKPPYIFVHDRKIEMSFYAKDGSLLYWVTPFDNLEYYIEKGYRTRDSMFNKGLYTYVVYTANGQPLGIRDFTVFIDTYTFRNVITDLYNQSSTNDDFITQVWHIIGQLSNYTSDEGEETPRFPSETLLEGGGDCEDLSILFASLIKAAPVNWYVDLVYIDSDNVLNPMKHNHVIVYINTGQKTYLVETTNDQVMLPYVDGVSGWLGSRLASSNKNDRYPVRLH